jgi:hypothetical protein
MRLIALETARLSWRFRTIKIRRPSF